MKMRLLTLAAMMALAGRPVKAEDLNLNEKPDTVQAPLSIYSFGLGAGVVSSINHELRDESPAFLKLSVLQSFIFADHWNIGLDMDWMLPGQNWGGDLSLDFLPLATGGIKPFVGAGGGFRYFDKHGSDFGHDVGASATVHAGVILDVLEELQMRIRVPYHVVANDAEDRSVGLDVGFLFSSPHRKTKVKKLIY
ncbi:MAG TPA: hypothetical protein VJ385_03000 [Fibrobacteria bacterium]|nr:hypothetical protein [Fibrobacteria bacterium]